MMFVIIAIIRFASTEVYIFYLKVQLNMTIFKVVA